MDKILDILNEIHPEFNYENSSDFIEDALLDSYDVIELVARLEEVYEIQIDGMDILPEYFCDLEAIKRIIVKNGGSVWKQSGAERG